MSPSDDKLRNKIRLYGIDCPEHGQAFGNRAGQAISDAVFGKIVSVQPVGEIDHYGRTVGIISVPDDESYYEYSWAVQSSLPIPDDLNSLLVREGMAWVDPQLCDDEFTCNELNMLEKAARIEKRGLWADKNPVPPWEWRKNNRMEAQ